MANPGQQARGRRYDVNALLRYNGPTSRRPGPLEDSINLLDFVNSDSNELSITTLLSSQGIPFHMVRPPAGWKGTQGRMILSVPTAQHKQALDLLYAAAELGTVELVSPSTGFATY